MIQTIGLFSAGLIVAHSMWCFLCPRVSDGILGKILYLSASLAAFAYLSNPSTHAQALLNFSFAAIGLRHWWMKTYWLAVRQAMMRILLKIGKH